MGRQWIFFKCQSKSFSFSHYSIAPHCRCKMASCKSQALNNLFCWAENCSKGSSKEQVSGHTNTHLVCQKKIILKIKNQGWPRKHRSETQKRRFMKTGLALEDAQGSAGPSSWPFYPFTSDRQKQGSVGTQPGMTPAPPHNTERNTMSAWNALLLERLSQKWFIWIS